MKKPKPAPTKRQNDAKAAADKLRALARREGQAAFRRAITYCLKGV